ncbi:hypothetical protein ACFLTQ_00960 [Chloroflexota bacterium]
MENGAGGNAFLSKLYGIITIENVKYDIIVKPSDMNIPAEFDLSDEPSGAEWAWNYSLPVEVDFSDEKCSGSLWWTIRTIAPDPLRI